jgi:hypothetical protein
VQKEFNAKQRTLQELVKARRSMESHREDEENKAKLLEKRKK